MRIQPPAVGGPYTLRSQAIKPLNCTTFSSEMSGYAAANPTWGCLLNSQRTPTRKLGRPTIPRFASSQSKVIPHITTSTSSKATGSVVSPETASSDLGGRLLLRPQGSAGDPRSYRAGHRFRGRNSCRGLDQRGHPSAAPDFDVPLAELDRLKAENAPEYGNYVMHWYDQYDIGQKDNWAAPDFDDSTWKAVPIPGGFAELGVPDTPALAWFRKEITLPDPLPAGRAMLHLGEIERMDTVYINGKSVGGSAWVENPARLPR